MARVGGTFGRHVDKKHPVGEKICGFLLEDKGTTIKMIAKHLASIGYSENTAIPSMSKLRTAGFAEKRTDNLWYRTKKPFKMEDLKTA